MRSIRGSRISGKTLNLWNHKYYKVRQAIGRAGVTDGGSTVGEADVVQEPGEGPPESSEAVLVGTEGLQQGFVSELLELQGSVLVKELLYFLAVPDVPVVVMRRLLKLTEGDLEFSELLLDIS